jgi:hypothetical protein
MYTTPKNTRRESRTLVGRFRGGKLAPVLAVPVKGNEAGMLSQSITMELDPIAGRMITPITGELISVFVPVQAIDAIKDPGAAYAGMTEVLREKLLSGNPLFGLENETEISKRLGVNPRSIAGVKKVNEMARLAHNAAVNHLRVRKYVNAARVLHSSTAITPAIIGQTVLDRLNGVLDPEDRVNGFVDFETGTVTAPVHAGGKIALADVFLNETSHGGSIVLDNLDGTSNSTGPSSNLAVKRSGVSAAPNPTPGAMLPPLSANLTGLNIGSISLTDFYNAQRMDELVRTMRQFVDDNPEYGEEIALRFVHGMSMEVGKHPIVIHESSQVFGRQIVGATDTAGVEDDVMRSDMMLQMSFSVPIPRSELGGVIITFAVLKPDETLASQPHPFLSDVWGADNFVADEMALDPVPVTIRELDSDCLQAQEANVALYVGHNGLKRTYVHYGLNRHLNPTTVANKTAIWQLEVPMSVTPQSVIYPESLGHYPFADQAAEVCTYTIASNLVVKTPLIFGPTPVEELAVLETENVFPE